ncbi:MAG: hypothetical protein OEV28_13550, partial [Nitrospirota bacterium]|nr:hypothetical protein [Nitrospirota bacterium]
GGRDPFVVLWFAVGPKGEVYFYREYYERELKGIKEHAANIRGFSRERIRDTYYDPSATQVAEDLMLEGITCNPANNERMAGRLRVTEYLTPTAEGHPPYPMQGKPREKEKYPHVYFFSTMRETFEEIAFFRWRDENMKKQDHLEGEKERTQGDDHAMDCLRYALMTRPSPSNIVKRTVPGSFDWYRKQITSRRRKGAFIGV